MKAYAVSVPLSGLTSVNNDDAETKRLQKELSFRPLIGVNFCKQDVLMYSRGIEVDLFPPPYRG